MGGFRKICLSIFVSTLALGLSSCGKVTQDVSRDEAIRFHLNQRNYEQAIILLREKLAESPNDDATKIQLASAYSGSVGINTIDCFEVLKPRLFDNPVSEKRSLDQAQVFTASDVLMSHLTSEESPRKPKTREERQLIAIKAIEKEFLKFASQASDALDIAFRLPHTPLDKRDRLVQSMALLSTIEESSSHYLTAQLYQGILSMVQFVNYMRDAVPVKLDEDRARQQWYLTFYCRLDLSVLMPNLSKSVDFMAIAFASLANAGRKSDNPVYENLVESRTSLANANDAYLANQDLFDFADWSIRSTKGQFCENK